MLVTVRVEVVDVVTVAMEVLVVVVLTVAVVVNDEVVDTFC